MAGLELGSFFNGCYDYLMLIYMGDGNWCMVGSTYCHCLIFNAYMIQYNEVYVSRL